MCVCVCARSLRSLSGRQAPSAGSPARKGGLVWVVFSVQLRRNDKSLAPDRCVMNFNTVPCLFAADVMGGGVTTRTRVSGEMVKPSMYNCLTLIKGGCRGGGDGSLGAKSPVSKPFGEGGGGWKDREGVSTPGGCWDAGL